MTIKKGLFLSNIRMLLVIVVSIIVAFLTNHIVFAFLYNSSEVQELADIMSFRRLRGIASLASFAVFFLLFSIINYILNQRMMKKITKPLEILNKGVKEIHENNLSYRIEYKNDDEFRPVCETFNQMAAQLETSTEQRLKDEANRRELLAGISHDLRTPLTAISGYLDGIESGVASTPEMRDKYLNTIRKNTAGMKHIIEQLFLFSKLDMNEFSFTPHRFDILRAISDIVEEVEEEYQKQGLHITIAENPESIFVYADVMQLRRVFINILENSARYKEKETGRIEISASLSGDNSLDNNYVQLIFADDGTGVNPEALPNLFNAFYRSDPSRHSKGSGLGLAICAKIIERSGGTIYAKNNEAGGLAVIINLPIETGAS